MGKKKLSELLNEISLLEIPDLEVSGISLNSTHVKAGDLFVAYQGSHLNGAAFIEEAIQKGAKAILTESPISIPHNSVPIIAITDLSQVIGKIASRFYEKPSEKIKVVGITGTNGKTSCSHFIARALNNLDYKCGVIGTLGQGLYPNIKPSSLTTPDAVTLQKILASFVKENASYTAMEVSSHGLDQGRVNDIHFEIGVFTNLTRDHLDYHKTMENYGRAKIKLFQSPLTRHAVINAEDPFGQNILKELIHHKSLYAYTTQKNNMSLSIPYTYATDIQLDLSGIRAEVCSSWGTGELFSPLLGQFNLSNLLATFVSLCILGIPFKNVLQSISKLNSVDGRMQKLGGENHKPLVVVDYSHTPDSLEKALLALRKHCTKKLYCVFGCGGDRDRGKRPMMAKIAETYADYVIVTDDNPRTENSDQIFQDILSGFTTKKNIHWCHDREKAIKEAISLAKKGDCILVAGKGAEAYQIIGSESFPFSDIEKINSFLKTY